MSTERKPKITYSMMDWLRRLRFHDGEMKFPLPTYDMAGRMQDAGIVEIVNQPGKSGWPYGGWHIKITDEGRRLLEKQL